MSNKINFLPPWAETNLQPAFYDVESGTCLQQTSRMYAKVNQLVRSVNDQNETIADYVQQFIDLRNFVDDYFDNLDVQEEINHKIDEMAENGELGEYFAEYVTPPLNAIDEKVDSNNVAINTKVDNYNQATNQRIDNIISGGISPLTATSTAGMTDKTRIYVNTTDGHWYYYANNNWVDGGLYQSSVDPTNVDNVLEYQYSKDLKYFFKFAVGNLNQKNGAVLSPDDGYKFNLITEEILQFDYDIAIPSNSYCRTDLFLYNDDNSFNKWFVCANNLRCYKIKAGTKFRIRLVYITAPSPQPDLTQDVVENALLFINYYACPFEFYKYIQLAKLEKDGYPVDPENLKYSLSLQIGDVGSAGLNEGIDQNKRMVTCNVLKYAYDVVIPKNSNFMVYLWTYSDLSGSGASSRGWLPLTTDTYVIPAGTMFRLLFVTSNSSNTPLYEVYDNPTFKVFELYKKEEKDVGKEYNKNCRSVAHQGYSPVFGEIGHCKLEAYVEAKKHGFDYGECDIKFSSDGVPVCSHDTTFDSDGVTIVIAEHTVEELKTYSYYGSTIATFEEVISKCKMLGLGLYIDHLNANWPDTNWNTIFYIVKKYQMLDNVYWLLNHVSMASRILTSYNKAKLVLLADSYANTVTAISNANAIKTDLNSVSVDFLFTTVSVSDLVNLQATANSGIEFEAWTLDTTGVYKSYMPFVSGITSNKVCYNDVYGDIITS